jgi:tRNA pseudouridine55 synthase
MEPERSGFLVVDKPPGMTSARVVAAVKRLLRARKVGHTGTLDPLATGLLICCVNRATRLSGFFLKGSKTYRAVLRLGVATDTQDAAGMVVSIRPAEGIREQAIRDAFGGFIGKVEQAPPVFSALKHRGVPLYRLARAGRPLHKPARTIEIHRLEILEIALPDIRFEIACSGGTYVRTVCADIGELLGCGGHMHALRRTETGGFDLRDAITLEELEERAREGTADIRIVSMADGLKGLPEITADAVLERKIRQGRSLGLQDLPAGAAQIPGPFVKIVDPDRKLFAVLSHEKEACQWGYHAVFQ